MAYPAYLREKARAMRVERQLGIDELAARLAVSRGTIYYWVRDLPLTRPSRHNSAAGNRRMQKNYRLCAKRHTIRVWGSSRGSAARVTSESS